MGLLSLLKNMFTAFLAPAEDPRGTYANEFQRFRALAERIGRARARLSASRPQMEGRIAEAKERLVQLEQAGAQDPFTIQIRQMVEEELRALESEVAQLEQEEQELALIEDRLSTEMQTLSARQQALEARHSATEARVRVRRELGGLSEDMAELGMALEQAEQRTHDVQARASVLEQLTGMSTLTSRVTLKDPEAQKLADRFASDASLEPSPELKRQLGLGFKTLLELEYEYTQIQQVVERRRATDPLSITYVPALAEETYKQGLSVLQDALDLLQAIRSPNKEKLEEEIAELEAEIARLSLEGTGLALSQAKLREDRVASHKERLEILQRQQVRVDELMYQVGRCAAALSRTRIELAGIKVEGSRTSVEAVIESLGKTVEEAREVQSEMKRLGF